MTKKRIFLFAASAFCLFMLVCAAVFPRETAQSVKNSLLLCSRSIVSSLFVFSALAALFARLGIFSRAGKAARAAGISPAVFSVALCGIICGFPTSAVVAAEMYRKGEADADEMRAVLPFCSNAGMAFVVGAVGGGMLGSTSAGYALFASQSLLSIVFILLFSRGKSHDEIYVSHARESFPRALTASVSAAGAAMINVCAFIVFFGAAADMICLVCPALPGFVRALLCSFLEISRGCSEFAAADIPDTARCVCVAWSLGFSGISVACQIADRAGDVSVRLLPYLAKKLVFGLSMAALYAIFALFAV